MVVIHDNASAQTQKNYSDLRRKIFGHSPYNPDLGPSDFYLFPKFKKFLGENSNEDLKEAVKSWLWCFTAEEYNIGFEKLITHYESFDTYGEHIKK